MSLTLLKNEIKEDSSCISLWQTILSRYKSDLLDSCQKSIELSGNIKINMFVGVKNPPISSIMNTLFAHNETKAHSRYLSFNKCRDIGLNVHPLEDDDELHDISLSIHHISMELFDCMPVYKIFCNQNSHILSAYKLN